MNVPSGYSALDLVGFTDKGDYSARANYVKNDLVHYDDKIWKCLIDDTTAIEPTEGVNWTLWIQQLNSLDGLADVEITNAQDGQEITYDGTTQKWKNTSKIQALTNYDANTGVKNLLPNKMVDIEGVTRNADGSITINGTFTSNKYINIDFLSTSVKYLDLAGLVGVPLIANILTTAVTGISGFFGYFKADNSYVEGTEVSTSAPITYPNDATYARTYIRVKSGTYNNIVVYPMLRDASITDDTYEPYAKTNQQLTQDTTGLLDNTEVNGAVNLLPNNATTQVKNGVTFTVNDDGSVTANGTASEQTDFSIGIVTLKEGQSYKVTGCPKDGSTTTYRLNLLDYGTDSGNGYIVNANSTIGLMKYVYIRINSGVTVSNIVFKPMITVADMPNSDYNHYVPYAKSNKELTDEKLDISSLKTITAASSDFADFKTRIAAL